MLKILIPLIVICAALSSNAEDFRPPIVNSNLTAGVDFEYTVAAGADVFIPLSIDVTCIDGSIINNQIGFVVRTDASVGPDPVTNRLYTTGIYTGQYARAVIDLETHLITGDVIHITNSNATAAFNIKLQGKRGK